MEFKFKVGQKVRVLDGENIENYVCGWNPHMNRWVGRVVTIDRCCEGMHHLPAYGVIESSWTFDERGLVALSDKDYVKKIIFNDPATIILWTDGTKTVIKTHNEDFDAEKGIAMCFMKKALGNKGSFNNVFKKWIPDDKKVSHKLRNDWTPCSINNPPYSGWYIAITASGMEMELEYSQVHNAWNVYDFFDEELAKERAIKVLVWRKTDDSKS